jgi:hypothetical protein
MRMDIEYSPGALGQRMFAAARDSDGPRCCDGGISGKRLCSMDHPATVRRERAGRFFGKRTMGVLWRHSSVNLVESRSIALAATRILRRLPKINEAVSITESLPQPRVAAATMRFSPLNARNLPLFVPPTISL